jgi:hypothetical protein
MDAANRVASIALKPWRREFRRVRKEIAALTNRAASQAARTIRAVREMTITKE